MNLNPYLAPLAWLVGLIPVASVVQPVLAAGASRPAWLTMLADGVWSVVPSKGFFLPGERATWGLSLILPASKLGELETVAASPTDSAAQAVSHDAPELTAEFRLYELAHPVASLASTIRLDPQAATRSRDGGTFRWTWEFSWATPPDRPVAIGLDWTVRSATGDDVAAGSSAFDTARRWVDVPRYGFLSDFDPSRGRQSPMADLLPYHITGLQFYDWMYRHHQYLPPTPVFIDPLGRRLSLPVVASRIQEAHRAGMAAMAYTAVYAAAPDFYKQHPDWALYKRPFTPWAFGDDFLYIMNPARSSPWHDWIIDQYKQVVNWGFDGIHADQYGDPKNGFADEGASASSFVDLAPALRDLLTDGKKALASLPLSGRTPGIGVDPALIFNAVNDWPTPQVAASKVDALYVEVWPPNDTYADVRRIVAEGLRLANGRPQIIAAYLDPANVAGVLLLDAVIFASGGYHIELGEFNQMLADPYFPKHQPVGPELTAALHRYYDFIVRYRPLLYGEPSAEHGRFEVLAAGATVGTTFRAGEVTAFTRQVAGHQVLHLLNLSGVSSSRWREPKETPKPVQDLEVRFYLDGGPHDGLGNPATGTMPAGDRGGLPRVFWSSPDEDGRPHELPVSGGKDDSGRFISVRVPSVQFWTMVWMEE